LTALINDYFKIGTIVKTQGLRGEVRVFPTTDEPSRFELLKSVQLFWDKKSAENSVYNIEKVRFHKNAVIIKFNGVDDCNAAEQLVGANIKILRKNALPLEEDEYYQADLLDLPVFTETGENLGTITKILQTGANDVYIVSNPNSKDLLIPAIKSCILSVKIAENSEDSKMIVHLLDGLREL